MPRRTSSTRGGFGPLRSFNEAGAKCPGELGAGSRRGGAGQSFNEAGAKCPGEQSRIG